MNKKNTQKFKKLSIAIGILLLVLVGFVEQQVSINSVVHAATTAQQQAQAEFDKRKAQIRQDANQELQDLQTKRDALTKQLKDLKDAGDTLNNATGGLTSGALNDQKAAIEKQLSDLDKKELTILNWSADQEKTAKAETIDKQQKAAADEKVAQEQQLREEGVLGVLQTINKDAQLPTFSRNVHRDAASAPGARNITSIALYILDFVKYILGGLAVLFIVVGAIEIITTSGNVEEVYKKQKDNLLYTVVGLFIVMMADTVVTKVFYGQSGEALADVTSAKFFAQQGANTIRGVYTAAEVFAGVIAILMIVYHSVRMLGVAYNEEEVMKEKKGVAYAAVGLAVIGISELLIKGILFKDNGSAIGYSELEVLLIGITNFIASFIGIVALLMLLYGGIRYVISAGDDEATNKAKTVIKGAVIGIIIALLAFGLTTTLISFKS